MNPDELKEFLDGKVYQYNKPAFIESDPIAIPHQFIEKEDIEIAGFLTATIAWGNRKSILRSASNIITRMDHAPHDFVLNHDAHHLGRLNGFVHRTFNHTDLQYFITALKNIYLCKGGLEKVFAANLTAASVLPAIHAFKRQFFELPHPTRTEKHISDPENGSVAKRINMFLRWMVRKDNHGVDFGIWKSVSPALLS